MANANKNLSLAVAARDGYSLEHAKRAGWSSISGHLNGERVDFLKRYLMGTRVLDAGCGGGAYVDYLARSGFDAVGIDKYDIFLENAHAQDYQGTFINVDLDQPLPFSDAEFDSSICFDVLEHVDDAKVLRELARITRRRLIVAVPNEDSREDLYYLTYLTYLDQTHLRYYTEKSLGKLVETVQPTKVEIFTEGRVPLELLARRELRVTSKYPLLARLYNRLFQFLLCRAHGPNWHVGLVAVIDFSSSESDEIL